MTSHTLACKLFLATVVTELVINLAIEANILWRFHVEINSGDSSEMELENSRRLPIYLIIYGLAYLWTLVLTVVAIRARNTVQIVGITAFNFAILAYAVIQIYELRKILGDNLAEGLPGEQGDNGPSSSLLSLPLNILTAVVIAVVATGSIILIILSYFIRRDFGWDRYRFLGADLQIRKFYFRFQIFECIAYFSAFFCAGFGIQFIWLVLQKTDVEYIITWIMFPLSILLLIMGRFAAKYENRYLMGAFEVGLFAGCAYFVFKLIRIWQQTDTVYDNVVASLTTFDALSLLSLMACFIGGAVVWSNFGKGLKEARE
ncbi:hypothetical protein BD324DRAFT_583956 [Kockovaella imperatae]|uniref:Uncharacterized protein n=1 Tax=Kockovaella imperatae TaxID=4999 RepID=A0A1Y1U842_9TREE|nr:hypothetical protein BD324DRAFT_583956 [Kockovaella imperatae]ORX34201.1 hypothetical protein BD324DRAFT_583956 [Kockovaella imperatae]